jgi:hypothetical protein
MRSISLIVLSACATAAPPPPKGGPRGLRASEHLDVAREHDGLAQRRVWPDVMTSGPDSPNAPNVPWFRSWDSAVEHERAADVHRSKAADLHAAYDRACGTRPLEEVSVSPLERYAIGGWNTTTGVILYLAPATGPDRLLADLDCHRAWMMLAPANMDDCPLDLPGLALDARGDAEGITVSIVIRDPRLVDELHRRAAVQLESAARRRANSSR